MKKLDEPTIYFSQIEGIMHTFKSCTPQNYIINFHKQTFIKYIGSWLHYISNYFLSNKFWYTVKKGLIRTVMYYQNMYFDFPEIHETIEKIDNIVTINEKIVTFYLLFL